MGHGDVLSPRPLGCALDLFFPDILKNKQTKMDKEKGRNSSVKNNRFFWGLSLSRALTASASLGGGGRSGVFAHFLNLRLSPSLGLLPERDLLYLPGVRLEPVLA
jgi:hypothetical protein